MAALKIFKDAKVRFCSQDFMILVGFPKNEMRFHIIKIAPVLLPANNSSIMTGICKEGAG